VCFNFQNYMMFKIDRQREETEWLVCCLLRIVLW